MAITVQSVEELFPMLGAEAELISSPRPAELNTQIRWAHIIEATQSPRAILAGAELILSTASGLDTPTDHVYVGQGVSMQAVAEKFLDDLEASGTVGLILEIRPDRAELLEAFRKVARWRRLPIYLFTQHIRFVEITQAVHRRIAAARLDEVETDRRVHDTFTQLSLASATPETILSRASWLLGQTVRWDRQLDDSQFHQPVRVGEEFFGSLYLEPDSDESEGKVGALGVASDTLRGMVLDRAAQALALSILAERTQQETQRSLATSLFFQLRNGNVPGPEQLWWQLERLAPVPFPAGLSSGTDTNSHYVWHPMVFQIKKPAIYDEAQTNRRTGILLDELWQATQSLELPLVAARTELGAVDVLLALPGEEKQVEHIIRQLAQTVALRLQARLLDERVVAGVADSQPGVLDAGRALPFAGRIATSAAQLLKTGRAASSATDLSKQVVFRASDLRLRGLLAALSHRPEVADFVSHQLGGLIEHSSTVEEFGTLLSELHELLAAPTNKAAAARQLHVSRPALYARYARTEKILGVDLEATEDRASLLVAVLAAKQLGLPELWHTHPHG